MSVEEIEVEREEMEEKEGMRMETKSEYVTLTYNVLDNTLEMSIKCKYEIMWHNGDYWASIELNIDSREEKTRVEKLDEIIASRLTQIRMRRDEIASQFENVLTKVRELKEKYGIEVYLSTRHKYYYFTV